MTNFFQMIFIFFVKLCEFIIFANNINDSNFNLKVQTPLKLYIKEDLNDFKELLYIEFSIPPITNNSTILINNFLPYYILKVNWFNNLTLDYFEKGVFYGFGQGKIFEKKNIFYDLKICKIFNVINRCEDYYMNVSIADPLLYNNLYNDKDFLIESAIQSFMEKNLKNNFHPILDTSNVNGTDDIYNYQIYPVSNESIDEFKSLIRFRIIQGIHTRDKYDLNFDYNNYLILFFGTFEKDVYDLDLLNKSILQRNDFIVNFHYFFSIFLLR